MRKYNSGFSLVETLIASGLLFILFAGVMIVMQLLLRQVGESRVRLVATSLAVEVLEGAKNLDYDLLGTEGGIPAGSLPQTQTIARGGQEFIVETSVIYVDDPFDDVAPDDAVPNDYKRIRVSVDWDGVFRPRSPIHVMTDVAPVGLETETETGTLVIDVINSAGQPVSNASVTIQADAVTPQIDVTLPSDSVGRVTLPGAPSCLECYRVLVTKSGYSSDRTYSQAEVANPVKPDMSVFTGQVSYTSLAIDTVASLTVTTTRSRQAGYGLFSGVQFILRGSKLIGTTTLDEPVYKYTGNHVTGANGRVVIGNLEWDTYDLYLPTNASIDVAGSNPLIPFGLSPGASAAITVVTQANTTHSLLLAIQNSANQLLPNAVITLFQDSLPVATQSAGNVGRGDMGQAYFGGLEESLYDYHVMLDTYVEATGSVTISGDMKERVYLHEN